MSGAKVIAIGLGCWWSAMFLLIGVLIAVHEALNVQAGRGDSVAAAFMLMVVVPVSIAAGIVFALKAYRMEVMPSTVLSKGHVFDPICNGSDECECGLVKSAEVHKERSR